MTLIFYGPVLRLLSGANCTKPNWRKRYVVNSFGILLPTIMLAAMAVTMIQVFIRPSHLSATELLALIALVVTTSFAGLIDDILGTRLIGGLRGHFAQLRFGIMTTGTLKAIVGFSISAIIAGFLTANIISFLIATAVLTLSINAINSFDLRPGRAIKVFSLASLAVFIATWSLPSWGYWGLIIPPVAGLLWGDMKEHSMMGDAGSNALGAILGFSFVINLSQTANLVILAVLVGLHLITEKYSISAFIEKAPLLKQLDELGLRR